MTKEPLGYGMTTLAVVTGTIVGTLSLRIKQQDIDKKIDQLLQQTTYQLRVENVIGNEAPEKFYVINNQRVYLEIDGKPVEQYCK